MLGLRRISQGRQVQDSVASRAPGRVPFVSIAMTTLVLLLLLWPGDGLHRFEFPGLDKLVHLCLFGGWTFALALDRPRLRTCPPALVVAAAIFGLVTETLQLFVPGRSFDLFDLGVDLAGGAVVAAALVCGARKHRDFGA